MQPRPTPREPAPGSADVATPANFVLASSGFAKDVVVQIEEAMMLSPNHPTNYLGPLEIAVRRSGGIDAVIAAFEAHDARHPGFGLADLPIAYRQGDQPEPAERAAQRRLAAGRKFAIDSWVNTRFRGGCGAAQGRHRRYFVPPDFR